MKKDINYNKYSTDNNSFEYDEKHNKTGTFLKQDNEFYNDEDNIPGDAIRVKKVTKPEEGWKIFINGEEKLFLKASRFSKPEKEYLGTSKGLCFIISGIKQGWSSVSEFKRNITT